MIDGSVMYVVFGVVTIILLSRARRSDDSALEIAFQITFVFYLSRVVALTLFPLPFDARVIAQNREWHALGYDQDNNFVPFNTIESTWGWTFFRQVLGNLVLLFPLGVLLPLSFQWFRSLVRMLVLVPGVAFGIESLQLAISQLYRFNYRSFDVDDLWLNTLGGLLGALVGLLLTRLSLFERLTAS